jgi:hypothetical protein
MRISKSALALALGMAFVTESSSLAYSFTGYRWPAGSVVRYYINPNTTDMPADLVISTIQAAVQAWNDQTNANLPRFEYMGTTSRGYELDGVNVFSFQPVNGSYARYWQASGSYYLEVDIYFGDLRLYLPPGAPCSGEALYLQSSATHEIGHLLGLNHSTDTTATMYPYTNYCDNSWSSLSADDIAGIEALYPPVSGGPTPSPTPSPTAISSPSPTQSADGTRVPPAPSIVDNFDSVWTIGSGNIILKNGVQAGGGYGFSILWYQLDIYVDGGNSQWYRWTGNGWVNVGSDPSLASPAPSPSPSPTPTVSPSPTPTASILSIAAITPNVVKSGTTTVITITGFGFVAGTSVRFENGTGNTPTVSSLAVASDGKSLRANLTVKTGGPNRNRTWDVVVIQPNGSSARLAPGLTVTP